MILHAKDIESAITRPPTSGDLGGTALNVVHVVLALDVGGMERIVLQLAIEGRAVGQNVSVLCLERPGVLGDNAALNGLRLISLGKRPGIRPGLVRGIRAALREIRPDVVHTHQIGALLYAGPAARHEQVPVILHTEHLNHLVKSANWNRRMRLRLLWWLGGWHADRFCCVSKDIADAARWIVPSRKLCVVDNGIPISDFEPGGHRSSIREAFGIPVDAPVVGVVARLNEVKCQDVLIQAMPEVRRRIPDAHLLLVGDGPTREALAELARTLHLTSCVHFAGYQSAPQRYLEAMDLFVLPSRLEGMPLAILEAWAARLPVVATRVGGVPNLVSEGETGLLVHSGDWKDLAENIIMVLSDKSLARRLGEGGRARVEVDFSSRGMAARYNQLYLEALKSR